MTLNLLEEPLTESVTVLVQDTLTGSALRSTDYDFFPSTTLTFQAGSMNGATQSLSLSTSTDILVEGPEAITLELTNPSQGTGLGLNKTHSLQIVDGNQATLYFTKPTSYTLDESTSAYRVTVGMLMDEGDELAVAATARVVDSGAGTATSGTDYVSFAAEQIEFPEGTSGSAEFGFVVTVQDDLASEGDETIVLGFEDVHPALTLTTDQHAFTITEDDFSNPPLLVVRAGPEGAETAIQNGGELDFGEVALGAQSNTFVIEVLNQGYDPMSLSTPVLDGNDSGDFRILVEGTSGMSGPDGSHDAPVLASPFVATGQEEEHGAVLSIDRVALEELGVHQYVTLHGLPTPGGGEVGLELKRLPSPWATDAVLLIDGKPADKRPEELIGNLSLWSGHVLGHPDSTVFLAVSDQGTHGVIRFSDNPGDELQLLSERLPDGSTRLISAFVNQLPSTQSAFAADFCAGERSVPTQAFMVPPGPDTGDIGFESNGPTIDTLITPSLCRLAIETDFQFYNKFGTVDGTTAYVTGLIAALSDVYLRDVQVSFTIAYLGIYTSVDDPWDASPAGTSSSLLDEFRDGWAPSRGGEWPVDADIAHFMSGANLGGGIAYVNVICNENYAFGVSANMAGWLDWDTWTGEPSSFTWDFVVVAHEIGHNFSARHTHEYCPPLDYCQDTCLGPRNCEQGTLMSYCHSCSGGMNNIDLEFHPHIANAMRSAVQNSCLGDATLPGSDSLTWRLIYEPLDAADPSTATLRFAHSAENTSSPFTVQLRGTTTD